MKNIGFFGEAFATTESGDVTVALAAGLDTVRGKSFEPFFQGALLGSSAGGAGMVGSAEGDQVIVSGGIDGKLGWAGAGLVVLLELTPHAVANEIAIAIKVDIRI